MKGVARWVAGLALPALLLGPAPARAGSLLSDEQKDDEGQPPVLPALPPWTRARFRAARVTRRPR